MLLFGACLERVFKIFNWKNVNFAVLGGSKISYSRSKKLLLLFYKIFSTFSLILFFSLFTEGVLDEVVIPPEPFPEDYYEIDYDALMAESE